ncbi:MAG: hypothetical protein HWN81_23885 [Candidatus Lokiarchaeota archaeon]|nr:hypothetical protein [Candidatus Lokiarchaeota archaeon]
MNLKIVFSHQDNKKDIQTKLIECLKKPIDIKKNFYNIETKDGLIQFLINKNSKKVLSIKEKNSVMMLCKHIIQYCKNNYDLEYTKYETINELQDDMDFIKQFGDIPSVRRCCRLMNEDPNITHYTFKPLISPQVQKELDEKKNIKKTNVLKFKLRFTTKDNPFIINFD